MRIQLSHKRVDLVNHSGIAGGVPREAEHAFATDPFVGCIGQRRGVPESPGHSHGPLVADALDCSGNGRF